MPTSQMWKLQAERTALCKSYLDYWNGSATRTGTGRPVDAIISPASVFSGNQIGVYRHVAYTGVWNILGKFPLSRRHRFNQFTVFLPRLLRCYVPCYEGRP